MLPSQDKPKVERTAQEWADYLATLIHKLLEQGRDEGWVSGLPPDAFTQLQGALDEYCCAYESRRS